MPVNTPHPQYAARVKEWQRCRDAVEGEDAVKSRATEYLPKPEGQEAREYESYLLRAMYYEAVGRTVDGYVGAISRKPAKVEIPPILEPIITDASADGISLAELRKRLLKETILQGRAGILVDYDEKLKRNVFSLYITENIINWWDGGIVLRENVYERDSDDPYTLSEVTQYRVLRLDGGVYTVEMWRENKEGGASSWYMVGEPITPKKLGGGALDWMPFYWLTCYGKTNSIERPPLMGLVNVSLAHYRNSADLEHGRHFTGLPTPYMTGVTDDGGPVYIGSKAILRLVDPAAKAGFMEFTGQGLQSLENALEEKEKIMASLGAAIFQAAQRKGVEAAETARIRIAGENSILMGAVDAIEESLTAALTCAARWVGADEGGISVKMNRDFITSYMEPQTLQGLVAAYQSGAYSLPSFLYALQQSDLIPPDRDLSEEETSVRKEADIKAAKEADLAIKVKGAGSGNTTNI